jgi:hypothetical protein
MEYDAFSGDNSEVEIPELDDQIEDMTEAMGLPKGEETTEDMLNPKSDRRLLTKIDAWSGPTPQPKQKQEAAPGDEADNADEQDPALQEVPKPVGPPVKSVSFKAGDKTFDVPESAVVSVRIDGKMVDVPVAELSTHYSGKVAWDKRFSELTNEKRTFAGERQKFLSTQSKSQNLLNEMHKSITNGDTFGAISSLVSVSGLEGKIDPRKFVSELRSAMIEQANQMAQLSPEERGQLEAREEYEYTKQQLAQLRQQRELEQNEYVNQQSFAKKMQESNVAVEDLQQSYDYLIAEGRTYGLDPDKVTPDQLLQHSLTVREYRTAIEALRDVSPELVENRQYQDEAVKLLRAYPGTTKEQLAEVFREAVGSKRSASVSKKVSKAPVSTPATAKARAKAGTPGTPKDDLISRISHKRDIW